MAGMLIHISLCDSLANSMQSSYETPVGPAEVNESGCVRSDQFVCIELMVWVHSTNLRSENGWSSLRNVFVYSCVNGLLYPGVMMLRLPNGLLASNPSAWST